MGGSTTDIGLYLEAATILLLAVVAGTALLRRGASRPARWLGAVIGAALAGVIGELLVRTEAPGLPDATLGGVVSNVSYALLPVFFYGFGREYHRVPTALDRAVVVVAALLVALSLSVPALARSVGEQDWWHQAIQALISLEALALVAFVAVMLRRDARDIRSPVVRGRMHLMSVAMGVIVAAYLLSAINGAPSEVLAGYVAAGAALLTLVSFAPTPAMRARWRRSLDPKVETVVLRLMGAVEDHEVTDIALPMIVDVCGARRVTLLGVDGHEIASSTSDGAQRMASRKDTPNRYDVAFPFGTIEVETDAYSPVFGDDESHLVHMLGAYAGLALERCALLHDEQRLSAMLRALVKQDDVVD